MNVLTLRGVQGANFRPMLIGRLVGSFPSRTSPLRRPRWRANTPRATQSGWWAHQTSQFPTASSSRANAPFSSHRRRLRLLLHCALLQGSANEVGVTPSFKSKTRCSSYVCPGSSCHTYGQNVSTENQCLYYIVSYYKNLLHVQKGLNSGMDTTLPHVDDRGFRTPRRSLHQHTPHLLSSRA
jgi:hypothetical protein